MKKIILPLLLVTLVASTSWAQDDDFDPSKPTNLYTSLTNSLEYIDRKSGGDIIGYRAEALFAFNDRNLLLAELPLQYNDGTNKFGLGDIRARYFWLPYKDYSKFFGAFGPSVDIFAPTGSFENGLGSSRWLISPGVTMGLMAAEWIQFFPVLSYQYASKPTTDQIAEAMKTDSHGITFQVITPIIFSEKLFVQVTPIYQVNDLNDERQDGYVQEIFGQYAIRPEFQLFGFFRGTFKDDTYAYRLGATIYF